MERKISKYLHEWKDSPYRKPLILQGARQTGKTYSILAFGREAYANVAYFNFETTPGLKTTFDESIASRLIFCRFCRGYAPALRRIRPCPLPCMKRRSPITGSILLWGETVRKLNSLSRKIGKVEIKVQNSYAI